MSELAEVRAQNGYSVYSLGTNVEKGLPFARLWLKRNTNDAENNIIEPFLETSETGVTRITVTPIAM